MAASCGSRCAVKAGSPSSTLGALRQLQGAKASAIRQFLPTITGPAQVWFNQEGPLALVASQQVAKVGMFRVNTGPDGLARPAHLTTRDIAAQDKPGFTPFLKRTPDGAKMGFWHKLAGVVSCRPTRGRFDLLSDVPLGMGSRPNHPEFVANAKGSVVNAGQTVCSAFDVSDPFKPAFVAKIPLGDLALPSGGLRHKKTINLVYLRPGTQGQTG